MTTLSCTGGGRPLVSICIPPYRQSATIADAVRSALSQDYADIEIIVIDDCSPDGTADAARAFGDPRLRVLSNERNLGSADNHNRCLDLAAGAFVLFLHGDDLLEPAAVRKLADALQTHSSASLAFSRRAVIVDGLPDGATQQWLQRYGRLETDLMGLLPGVSHPGRGQRVHFDGRAVLSYQLHNGVTVNRIGEPSNVMIRRQAARKVGGFSRSARQAFDVDMWLRLLTQGDAVFVNENLAVRRLHAGSLTAQNVRSNAHWLDGLQVTGDLLPYAQDIAMSRAIRRAWLAECRSAALICWRGQAGPRRTATAALLAALRDTFSVRTIRPR